MRHAQFEERERAARPTTMRSTPSSNRDRAHDRCNLACIQCLRSRGLKPYALGDIAVEDFRHFDQFPDALHVCLNGFGEPLMHPRFFEDRRDGAARCRGRKSTSTATASSSTTRTSRRSSRRGSPRSISIDAAKPETYRKVRRGGRLETVHANLRRLVRHRAARRSALPLAGVNFVMLDENEGELVPFLEQAADMGVEDLVNCVTLATHDWGFENRRTETSYRREIAAARRRPRRPRAALPRDALGRLLVTDPDAPFACDFFWGDSIRITFEGEVTLGCCTPFKETYSYGNVLERPFREIWNGERFARTAARRARARRRARRARAARGARRGSSPKPLASPSSRRARVNGLVQISKRPRPTATRSALRVVLVNPPGLPRRTNERTFSGGIGVSRRLKPFEREPVAILPIDFLYLAAVAERAGARVTLVDLLLNRHRGAAAERFCP